MELASLLCCLYKQRNDLEDLLKPRVAECERVLNHHDKYLGDTKRNVNKLNFGERVSDCERRLIEHDELIVRQNKWIEQQSKLLAEQEQRIVNQSKRIDDQEEHLAMYVSCANKMATLKHEWI